MLKHPFRSACALAISAFLFATGCASHGRPPEPEANAPSAGQAAPASSATSPAPVSVPPKTVSRQQEARREVEAGNDLMKRGQYDEAEHSFRLALEAEPGSLEAVAGLGRIAVQRGQYSEAVPLLERATRVSSQTVSAFQALGDAYAATGDVERAAVAYRQAVALAPEDLDSRLSLARSLTEIGEYSEAEDVCSRAMRIARENPAGQSRVHQALGDLYSRQGLSPAAMSAYYKAAELNPGDAEVTRGLATCAVGAGLYAEAAAAYTKLLQLKPLDLPAKKQLAWVNFKLERYPLAISNYEAIRDSLGTVDRYYLAQAYAKSSKVDRAVEQFREVVRLDKENYKGVYCNMAYAYYEANRYESAIKAVHEGLQEDSTSACLHFCWAQALDKLGRHKDAIPVFEAALGDPAYAEAAKRELERQRRIVRLLESK
jgi:tetratricopeptide (TPR) repeat protein